ncbi:hypothetical protein APICC_00971 [Apis cerana cerana]|uniref:Uncharacterized protein n=1 Tax=Apis cerana cerana TaxID=94128 RepID=A0A2A3E5X3_APICC|nr:hypothetical protein APICC_00971 [Apis cerana cerana]
MSEENTADWSSKVRTNKPFRLIKRHLSERKATGEDATLDSLEILMPHPHCYSPTRLCLEAIRKQHKYRVHTRALIGVNYYTVAQCRRSVRLGGIPYAAFSLRNVF